MKEKFAAVYDLIDQKFFEQFEFHLRETNLRNLAVYMHKPKDASSLAVTRILFGIAMLFDIPDERGGAALTERWGDLSTCHFPLLPFIRPLPMPHMAMVYAALWLGALGIALGYKFRVSSITFTACFWYLLLVEKSYWNNHSYLFGLVGLLLTVTQANCYWSIDAYLNPSVSSPTVPYWNYFILKYQFFILYFMAGVKKCTAEWLTGYSVQNLSEHWVFNLFKSIDAYLNPSVSSPTVPYWNYFILKYQFFILYFMAGVKKCTAEWLTGYSVQNLSEHWVFNPFKLFLSVSQTDYLVVHWFVFAFDLTVAGWMMWSRSRHIAMILCALFHLMNSRLFRIGMFPWVCLATMPLFYPFDWPKLVFNYMKDSYTKSKAIICKYKCMFLNGNIVQVKHNKEILNEENTEQIENDVIDKSDEDLSNEAVDESLKKIKESHTNDEEINKTDLSENDKSATTDKDANEGKRILTCILIGIYVFLQGFLPFSHFITKGYNNWTNGLYGYSWDMMVHTWDMDSVIVKVVDNEKNIEFYVDPHHLTPNERWSRHGDMVHQYARCIKDNIMKESSKRKWNNSGNYLSENISIYIDVWASLNGRFTQRMFDPKVDMLNVSWSPFSPISYLMPLLDEGLSWREQLLSIRETVHSWNNNSDVVFLADFPGYEYEKYVPEELKNVTLTVLEGIVVYEPEALPNTISKSFQLRTGNNIELSSGIFHKIINIGETPAYYMYIFYNSSSFNRSLSTPVPKLPIAMELRRRFNNMAKRDAICGDRAREQCTRDRNIVAKEREGRGSRVLPMLVAASDSEQPGFCILIPLNGTYSVQ
ncbi:Vitamin K-dependent gamma-carboxylase [Papilio machaon]|uniref:Vitamin K-dependent gamma-carboxylase n=1 Tax=Papilio machaon TaxID=76193 RepID=A0A194RBN4_PAPMA|nr:Vitamin K-dependent gamma-carboxylase [Papilio machaon]